MNQAEVSFRPHSPEDSNELVELARQAATADKVDEGSTLEKLPSEEDLSSPELLIAEDAETGKILGYGAVRWWQEDSGTLVYLHSGTIHPEARGKGVGSLLLRELQAQAQALAAEQPGTEKVFGANASETEEGSNELLEANGYQKVWSQVEMKFTSMDDLSMCPRRRDLS